MPFDMKNLLTITLLALTVAVQAESEKPSTSVTDKQAIEKLINEYGDAIKSAF